MRKVSALLAAMILCVLLACPSVLGVTMSERDVADAMALGDAAIEAKDIAGAIAIFAAIVRDAENSPSAPKAMMILGALQFKTDRATGTNTYRALLEKYPGTLEESTVLFRIAAEDMRAKRFRDCQDAFRAASENKNISNLNRGRALLQVGFVEMMKYFAEEYWDRAVDGSPILVRPDLAGDRKPYLDNAKAQFQATRALFAESRNPEIAAVADAALGEVHLLSEEPALAEVAYLKVLNDHGPIPDRLANLAQYGLGQAYFGQGDLARALQQFDQALNAFSPGGAYGFGVAPVKTKASIHAWKVLSLYGLKRFDEALVAAREGKSELEADTALAGKSPTMELWEGLILCRMGWTSEGLSVLRAVVTEHEGTDYATHANTVISQFEEGVK